MVTGPPKVSHPESQCGKEIGDSTEDVEWEDRRGGGLVCPLVEVQIVKTVRSFRILGQLAYCMLGGSMGKVAEFAQELQSASPLGSSS